MRKAVSAILVAGVVSGVVLTHGSEASAQNVVAVTPTGKGITGCALLGAETVALIEAAAGVRPRWAYIVGPLLGAAGGGVGGYFLEQAAAGDTTLTAVSVGTLVLGLGLVVPTVIAYVNATTHRPEEAEANEDNAPSNAPIDEGSQAPASSTQPASEGGAQPASQPASGGSSAPASTPASGGTSSRVRPGGSGRRMAAQSFRPTGLVDFGAQGMSFAVPAVSVENSVSLHDMRQYGLAPQTELRVPLLSGAF